MIEYKCIEKKSETEDLSISTKTIKEIDNYEVVVDVLYCGLCHTDIHLLENDWNITNYPIVPGHEIVGKVRSFNSAYVKNFKINDIVGIGYIDESCGNCKVCKTDNNQYCPNAVVTCFGITKNGRKSTGGIAETIVVNYKYLIKIPSDAKLPESSSLLCAGVTVYTPLEQFNLLNKNNIVGVVGMGGLGQIAIKILTTKQVEVVGFDVRDDIEELGKQLNCSAVVNSKNSNTIKQYKKLMDNKIIKTVYDLENLFDAVLLVSAVGVNVDYYINMLKPKGTLITIGIPGNDYTLNVNNQKIVFKGIEIVGSFIGSVKQMQNTINVCTSSNIYPNCEIIPINIDNEGITKFKEYVEKLKNKQINGRCIFKIKKNNI